MAITMINQKFTSRQLIHLHWMEICTEWKKTIRQPSFTIPTLMFPIMFYLFFGIIFSQNQQTSDYLLITYGVFGIIGPALFAFGVGIAIERNQGWFDLKSVSPMPISALILARIVVAMLFGVIIIIGLFVVAYSLGGVRLEAWQWSNLMALLLIGSLPFCVFGLALGLILKANGAPAIVNMIYLPIAFLSGLWFPITLLPSFMQQLANAFPPYHLSQLALKVIDADVGASSWLHAGSLSAFTLICFGIIFWAYNRKESD